MDSSTPTVSPLRRPELLAEMQPVRVPRTLPVVLSC